ncbi:MAG: glycosyltransferase family 4 protein [Chloroflexota bacterium]
MRIVLLSDKIPPENRGGAGIVTWRLAQELHRQGHVVHLIASTQGDTFREQRDGIMTYHIYANYPLRFRAWLSLYNPQVNSALKALYQEIQPDVINAHNIHLYLTYHSMVIAHRMNIPVVFSSHDVMLFAYQKLTYFIDIDDYDCEVEQADYRLPAFYNLRQMRFRYNPLRNVVIRRILKRAVQVQTAPSQELCKAHHANDLPQFECVHNGIDIQQFDVSQENIDALRQRLGLTGKKVILFAGRLTGAKGTWQLLQALQQVIKTMPEARLLILSSVPIEEQIQADVFSDLRDYIISGGWLSGDELAAAFRLADVMVAPSVIFDTFPTVNLEAMASHTVAIASCFGGSREAIIDGETGFVIQPFDTATFADRLTYLLQDDEARQAMASKAYDRVQHEFTLEQQAHQMIAHYQRAIDTL